MNSRWINLSKPSITINTQEGGIMKKIIVTLAFALIVPVAFAQTSSKGKGQGAATVEPITVTGTTISMTTEEGTTASYQPVKTLVVREDSSNKPGTYVIRGPGRVMNKAGQPIRTAIKPGVRVRVVYVNMGNSRVVDSVIVE
jgi:hypothetical protein